MLDIRLTGKDIDCDTLTEGGYLLQKYQELLQSGVLKANGESLYIGLCNLMCKHMSSTAAQ